MSDEEYSDASAEVVGKGLIAAISDIPAGKEVTLTYHDLDGETFLVSGKATTATFEIVGDAPQTYPIHWDTDGDGDIDDTTTVAHGTIPAHVPGSMADSLAFTYPFIGWNPALSVATGEKTYTAQFSIAVRMYQIHWDTDGDGAADDTTFASFGSMPYHTDGFKPSTAAATYLFTGWAPSFEVVTAEKTYTATFSRAALAYPIQWDTDGDGDVDDTTISVYDAVPVHADGSKANTAEYRYTFTGWDPEPAAFTSSITYTAQFSRAIRTYDIYWDTNGDGNVDDTTTVAYGTIPTHADGSRSATASVKYNFTGWLPELTPTTVDKVYVAQFTARPSPARGGSSGGSTGGSTSGSTGGSTSGSANTPAAPTTVPLNDQPIPEGSPTGQRASSIYRDVPVGAWYETAVQYVTELGLFTGVLEDQFAPETTLTRGMLVTVLWRLENEPASIQSNPFADVSSGAWYTDAIIWAAGNSIVEGYDNNSFGPTDQLTREQMAAILYRYATFKGYDISATADMTLYEDSDMISEWALPAMRWAVATDLISGITPERLAPKGGCSRAECAVILTRFLQTIVKDEEVAIKP
jgi:hypothetical protein